MPDPWFKSDKLAAASLIVPVSLSMWTAFARGNAPPILISPALIVPNSCGSNLIVKSVDSIS